MWDIFSYISVFIVSVPVHLFWIPDLIIPGEDACMDTQSSTVLDPLFAFGCPDHIRLSRYFFLTLFQKYFKVTYRNT